MKKVLNFLANPYAVAFVSFLISLPLLSRDLEPIEYITSIPFVIAIFSLPFVLLSIVTRQQLAKPKTHYPLVGLWIGAVATVLLLTISILMDDSSTAALGFLILPVMSLVGAAIGYSVVWLLGVLSTRTKKF